MQDNLSRLITTIAALAMIVTGGLLTISVETSWSACGAVLVGLASALLSLGVSEVRQLDRAREMVGPYLEPVCDQFLESISLLRLAIRDFRDQAISDETAGELIAAHVSSLESALRNLHAYSGVKSDRDRLRTRRAQTRIEGDDDRQPNSDSERPGRSADVDDRRISEIVACPYCSRENDVLLGPDVGDSQSKSCSNCQRRFNIHRNRHGEAFTNDWAGIREFDCPACSGFTFKYRGYQSPRYCLNCFAYVAPDGRGGGRVERTAEDPVSGDVVGHSVVGNQTLRCSRCNTESPTFIRYQGYYFAVCDDCRVLVRAADTVIP